MLQTLLPSAGGAIGYVWYTTAYLRAVEALP